MAKYYLVNIPRIDRVSNLQDPMDEERARSVVRSNANNLSIAAMTETEILEVIKRRQKWGHE